MKSLIPILGILAFNFLAAEAYVTYAFPIVLSNFGTGSKDKEVDIFVVQDDESKETTGDPETQELIKTQIVDKLLRRIMINGSGINQLDKKTGSNDQVNKKTGNGSKKKGHHHHHHHNRTRKIPFPIFYRVGKDKFMSRRKLLNIIYGRH